MELQLLVLREKKNMFLARPISERQRGADMAFIPDRTYEVYAVILFYHRQRITEKF